MALRMVKVNNITTVSPMDKIYVGVLFEKNVRIQANQKGTIKLMEALEYMLLVIM